MFAIFDKPGTASDLALAQARCSRCRRATPSVLRTAAVLTFLFVAAPNGMFVAATLAAATLASDDNQSTAHSADDALTRENMADLGRPEPTPPPAGSMTPIPPTRSRVNSKMKPHADPKDFAPRHRQFRYRESTWDQPQIVVQKRAHRNPAVNFVYWWNGWVIRNFHTKFGTVLLGTVGAKT